MMRILSLFALVAGASAYTTGVAATRTRSSIRMAENSSSRRQMVQTAALGVAALFPALAGAEINYDGVKYLGGGDKVDVNNANIRAFTQYPGMYPSAASKILKAMPDAGYKSASDLYGVAGLTDGEKNVIKKWENKFVFLEPKPEYVIDRLNNGLYR
ncbi:chloroplast psbU [Pavlovales sp. CCMP2436]|nr:chloroplast psbU [Pavlovales sp. CCMP2436]|mmetsp:Transcript_14275/g.36287  ORF Transcript_14275/g.36287 Transcript_14275/m.36287 type:complete len:157 (+) Transcript_14275:182-652(+)